MSNPLKTNFFTRSKQFEFTHRVHNPYGSICRGTQAQWNWVLMNFGAKIASGEERTSELAKTSMRNFKNEFMKRENEKWSKKLVEA
jgi:hypothetical protein